MGSASQPAAVSRLTRHRRTLALGHLLLWIACAQGGEPPILSPDRIEGVTLLDAEGVIELATRTPELVIVDSRVESNRKHGYIEGSLSLADRDTDCDSLGNILPSLDTPTLFYCNGPRCGRSAVAVQVALDCGYRVLYWFRGGVAEWKEKSYPLPRE